MVHRYSFNWPWPGVIIGALFLGVSGGAMAAVSSGQYGFVRYSLLGLGWVLAALGLVFIVRRILLRRWLELTDEEVLFPRGFLRTRMERLRFRDIIRIGEGERFNQASVYLHAGGANLEIGEAWLGGFDTYKVVRNFIFEKVGIDSPALTAPRRVEWYEEFPKPILRWKEPEGWPRYRTSLVRTRPRAVLVGKEAWFFVRCMAVIFAPWWLMKGFGMEPPPTVGYAILATVVSLFFTWVHWMYVIWPVHATEITVRAGGITRFGGKQTWDWSWAAFTGWSMVERLFEDRPLHILLLKHKKILMPMGLPDLKIRDSVIEVLTSKGIPRMEVVEIPWEEPKIAVVSSIDLKNTDR
jgi:hypothetical protein